MSIVFVMVSAEAQALRASFEAGIRVPQLLELRNQLHPVPYLASPGLNGMCQCTIAFLEQP